MGPLSGVRAVEIASLGPGPFCAMLLSDMGADVIRVDRADAVDSADGSPGSLPPDYLLHRGRPSVAVDLKDPDGVETVLKLADRADVFIEGFRPGVAERLGIAPDVCLPRNPALVYGRMTGWGQDGPNAQEPGSDINYIAITGALAAIGRRGQPPTPPMNLLGDFGGGGMLLAVGVLAALHAARESGLGQVVDAAIADGTSLLSTAFHGWLDLGLWSEERGTNLLDSGAPFYEVYETSDGRFVAVGAHKPKFYASLLRVLGLDEEDLPGQNERDGWPQLKARFAEVFRTRTRDEWAAAMEGAEACFSPVLTLDEAHEHPLNTERQAFIEHDGVVQPAPAPRFTRTASEIAGAAALPGQHSRSALLDWGFGAEEVERLLEAGAIRANPRLAGEVDAR